MSEAQGAERMSEGKKKRSARRDQCTTVVDFSMKHHEAPQVPIKHRFDHHQRGEECSS
ncbi:Hypothetical protein FKW44_012501, partial [Caligus rogercresseyi]